MRKHGTVWAYVFLIAVALTLMGMRHATDKLDDTHSSVAVQQMDYRQVGVPLPVTPTAVALTVTDGVTATTTPTVTPAVTPTLVATVTATPTIIPTGPPTPDMNPFTPTPTNTAVAIFLPSIVREEVLTLRNGDFEAGKTGWQEDSKAYGIIFSTEELGGVVPHGGEWAAWLGGYIDEESALTQVVTVPSDRPFLHYWYKIEAPTRDCAGGEASVIVNKENIYRNFDLCEPNGHDWSADKIDLSQYSEQTITLRFYVKIEADDAPSSFFVDDIEWIAQ